MNEQRPSKELVHFYAGFPGKALCLNTDTPIGTNSNIHWENVTCPRCWIDFLIGDGKRDNIIVPMSIARDVQAALRAGAPEPPGNALLGAAQVRVQHYERALRKVREQCDCNGDLLGVTICDEALYSDSPTQPLVGEQP